MKRSTPMKRHTPLRSSQPARASSSVKRPRQCRVKLGGCGESFYPERKEQIACSKACAISMAPVLNAKKEEAKRKEQRRAEKKKDDARREALKGVPQLKKEAQEEFNRYVRLRDAGKGCFVCGVTLVLGGLGGGFDAGHIRSRSNADNLRFDERNVHGQCKPCNAVGATKDWQMREAADRLLGPEVAAELYADNKPIKWGRDQLREIRDTYRRKANELEKSRG